MPATDGGIPFAQALLELTHCHLRADYCNPKLLAKVLRNGRLFGNFPLLMLQANKNRNFKNQWRRNVDLSGLAFRKRDAGVLISTPILLTREYRKNATRLVATRCVMSSILRDLGSPSSCNYAYRRFPGIIWKLT